MLEGFRYLQHGRRGIPSKKRPQKTGLDLAYEYVNWEWTLGQAGRKESQASMEHPCSQKVRRTTCMVRRWCFLFCCRDLMVPPHTVVGRQQFGAPYHQRINTNAHPVLAFLGFILILLPRI